MGASYGRNIPAWLLLEHSTAGGGKLTTPLSSCKNAIAMKLAIHGYDSQHRSSRVQPGAVHHQLAIDCRSTSKTQDVRNNLLEIPSLRPYMVPLLLLLPFSAKPPKLTLLSRLELDTPCGPDMNLLTCPDYSPSQPFGPAEKPSRFRWAPEGECPSCDYNTHDMRRRRMIVVKRCGWRVGLGPARQDLGVDVITRRTTGGRTGFTREVVCCAVM